MGVGARRRQTLREVDGSMGLNDDINLSSHKCDGFDGQHAHEIIPLGYGIG